MTPQEQDIIAQKVRSAVTAAMNGHEALIDKNSRLTWGSAVGICVVVVITTIWITVKLSDLSERISVNSSAILNIAKDVERNEKTIEKLEDIIHAGNKQP